MAKVFVERFWSKVQKSDGCWNWTGCTLRNGYGLGSIENRATTAHRIAWKLTHGAIPDGLCVLHRCDNRRCVRPDHLFLGTKRDNAHDRDAKGRQAKGAQQGLAKLDEASVLAIRARYAAGGVLQKTLADQYNISPQAINYILRRRNWRHL